MKRKITVIFATVCSVVMMLAGTALAATKVKFNPYYTAAPTGSVLSQNRTIDATGSKYYGWCTSAASGCTIHIHVPGSTDYTLGAGQDHNFNRTPSPSGNMTVTGTLIHGSTAGGATAYLQKK